MEFKEVVPSKITTVILPTGTLEPHGVINNGADNTAPAAMAQTAPPTYQGDPDVYKVIFEDQNFRVIAVNRKKGSP